MLFCKRGMIKISLKNRSGFPFCSAEHNGLCYIGRGYYVEHFCGISLN